MQRTLILLSALLLFAVIGRAQALSSVSPNTLAPGYSGTFTVTAGTANFSVATAGINLRLTHVGTGQIYNFGNAPGGGAWAPGYNGMPATTATGNITLPGNAPVGQYNVLLSGFSGLTYTQNLSASGNSMLTVSVPPNVGYFSGKVVLETDSNCVQSVGENGLANKLVYANPGGYITSTDAAGVFNIPLPLGTYTFSTLSSGASFVCPSSPYTLNATVNTSGGSATGINFFMKSNHQLDLSTTITAGIHRPGFSNNQWWATVTNNTPTAAPNTVLKVVKQSNISYISYSIPPTSVLGDTAYFNLGTVAGNTSMSVWGLTYVPVNTLGQSFVYNSVVTTTGVDTQPFNNTSSMWSTIQGSYDPNDKQVWTGGGAMADGFIEPTDTTLRYLIRFQNTGTDTAFNIFVRDTFDTDLDMPTLQVTGASHPYQLLIPDSTGRRIVFNFPNIMLQDSFSNEPESHGWIQYTIKKKNGLANGTAISNRASIYFDFNAPVLTNTVTSTICPSLDSAFNHSGSGQTISFQGPTAGAANGWSWNFGDGGTGTGANPSHYYASGGSYTVCVTVTNACGRSVQVCNTIQVNCNPLSASFNNNAGGSTTVQFTNTSGVGYNTVLWQFGDGSTSTQTSPSHTYSSPGAYTVCLILGNGCGDHDTTCVPIVVGCASTPVSNFSSSVSVGTATFTNSSTGTGLSYAWTFGDGGTSILANPTHTYTAPGTYQVCLTITDACLRTANFCDIITVTCVAPVSIFNSSVNQAVVTFTDLSTGSVNYWAWDFGDGNIATTQNPTHTYTASGTYNVCLSVSNACSSDVHCQSVTVIVTSSMEAILGSATLSPNPASTSAILRIEELQAQTLGLSLHDATGRSIGDWLVNGPSQHFEQVFDLSHFAPGMYFLRLNGDGVQKTLPIQILR